jgi:outer membrane murein-binding lipoprotein Lpp
LPAGDQDDMSSTPMELIRKLDETASALRELASQVRRAAPEVDDEALRAEMLESAAGLERRANDLTEAVTGLRVKIN